MKTISLFLLLVLIAVAPLGCGTKKKNEKKGAIESVIDYGTGQTPIEAGQRTKAKVIQISIQNAVQYYRVQEERQPTSLQDLVDAGYLKPSQTNDEYGRPLQSGVQDGKLVVRSLKADGTLSWEKAF